MEYERNDKSSMVFIVLIVMMCAMFHLTYAIATPVGDDQRLTIFDQTLPGKPIAGATLTISDIPVTLITGSDGSVKLNLVPAGRMEITVTWKSVYNPEPVTIARSTITVDRTLDAYIISTVYDAELQVLSSTGMPITNAEVWLAGVFLGTTDADGIVYATQIPSWHTPTDRSYPVMATWFGVDISPGEINITSTGTYVLTARNVATLMVHVIGAQGQGLNAAHIEIKKFDGIRVYSGVSNEQGIISLEVPYGTYNISVHYKGFTNTALATVSTPTGTVQIVATSVFIEVFGMAMTFATFVLWIIIAVFIVLVLAIAIHEYHIYRRKKLPQLFGVTRVRGV